MFNLRFRNAGQKLLRERAQILLAVIGNGDAGRGCMLDSGKRSFIALNPGERH